MSDAPDIEWRMSEYRKAKEDTMTLTRRPEPPNPIAELLSKPVGCLGAIMAAIVVLALLFGLHAGYKEYRRYQIRADATNQVKVHARLIKVEEQKAIIRVTEARGIAESQAIINETLTPLYITHEAIQAQEKWAESGNGSVIYIPVGENGVPLVRTLEP